MYSLDAARGTALWTYCLAVNTSILLGTPALSTDGAAVFCTGYTSHSVIALDAASGAELWTFVTANIITGSVAFGDDDCGRLVAGIVA